MCSAYVIYTRVFLHLTGRQQSLNIGWKYQCCHDPLSLRQFPVANSWAPGTDTVQQIYITIVLDAHWVILLQKQHLYIPSGRVAGDSVGCLCVGKGRTWRRSQHGLVGWETTVNSGPFSQLPAETNTNNDQAIVSKEATRHLRMLTEIICSVWLRSSFSSIHITARNPK